ncbi:AGC protein kinase [Saprolegnia diclina VS20]|uniref:AGC protein kinase n=1 Tax=Saprolegnia diclina (strain VS20) TaxID=1156394 RepID=T0QQG9_SAPDV|nr:AGC protein kinase [Saprolegnia diclina VS20]EQC40379.1 AGC protein kinase [Saprolegnia diclina VS20]|eukprot:XP_008606078.1 AGC protein kinase [Saprolegnia diclina VS20]
MQKIQGWFRRKKSNTLNGNSGGPTQFSSMPPAPMSGPAVLRTQASRSNATPMQPEPESPPFSHPLYSMDNDGMLRFKATGKQLDENDITIHQDEILNAVVGYVHETMKSTMGFQEVYLPSTGPAHLKCNVFVSSNYLTAKKLIVFVAVSRGLSPGLWSRGLILNSGVKAGSMLSYFRKALDEGYGIVVPNPNKNAVMLRDTNKKVPIPGSSSPEEHMDSVWDAFVAPSEAKRVFFIGYSYGGVLIKYLLQSRGEALLRRNGAIALIESSHRIEDGDAQTVKSLLAHRAMYWEVNHDVGFQQPLEGDAPHRTGCTCLSAGKPPRAVANHYYVAAFCIKNVADALFRFLAVRDALTYVEAEKNRPADIPLPNGISDDSFLNTATNTFRPDPNAPKLKRTASDGKFINPGSEKHCNLCLFHFTMFDRRHHCRMCHRAVCNACSRDRLFLPGWATAQRVCTDCASDGNKPFPPDASATLTRQMSSGSTVGEGSTRRGPSGSNADNLNGSMIESRQERSRSGSTEKAPKGKLSVDDFDLMKVIGKGAFGKVMLVRRKAENGEDNSANATYAMKVLKKANVFAKNQVEHTKAERRILRDIDHPFVVRLRYAFQTEDKLYLVMDYYTGGTLFFHLRKSRKFSEKRARFYAAQLLMAMSHLHDLNIAYRDLKLENILMDDKGYVALTDFGLSKENVDVPDGAKTFCGTAEYIAPELLKGLSYGKPVDWWGFGTLLFEMMTGQTPFFDRNRKKMFHNILHRDVVFTPVFSEDAKSLLTGLLRKDPAKRLGSGPSGAQEIMDHPFFASIDWDKLMRKEMEAPFKPTVTGEHDTTNVAGVFLREPPKDSPVTQQLGATHRAQAHFDGFTYNPGTVMSRDV